MRDLWPNAEQNLPEDIEISKVFENLEQAIECVDEAFKNEKQFEDELLNFMQIYRRNEGEHEAENEEISSDVSQANVSNEST